MNKRFLRGIVSVLMVAMLLCSCNSQGDQPNGDDAASTTVTENTTVETTAVSTTEGNSLGQGIYIPRPEKDITRILMIGNSSCYYYVDELAGIASADGKEIVVANLYKSGCTLKQHWQYYLDDANECDLFYTRSKGRGKAAKISLSDTLGFAKQYLDGDWDVIALHQRGYYTLVGDAESAKPETMPYAEEIYDLIRQENPESLLFWIQTWAYDVGYASSSGNQREAVPNVEKQNFQYEETKKLAEIVSEAEGVNIIPQGDAWQIARKSSVIGQTLCARKGVNNDRGDYSHDGDIGGGQYLNACVWYEILMGKSCIGNTWRPTDYELSEEKITILQNAAHEAVAAMYGPNYAQ